MILQCKEIQSDVPRTVELPIHPAVSLEDWVALVSIAMIDNDLPPDQQADFIEHLRVNQDAGRIYGEVIENEIMLSSHFAAARSEDASAARSNETVEAFASPIW